MNYSKPFSFLLMISLVAIAFSACPYDSSIGLCSYDEARKINKSFIGKWTAFGDEQSKEVINISKGDKNVFHIQHTQYDEDGKQLEAYYYRAFSMLIGDNEIFTLEKKDGNYNFYFVEWQGKDVFALYGANDDYAKSNYTNYADPELESLKEYIEEHFSDDGFFDEPIHFYRNQSDAYYEKKKAEK